MATNFLHGVETIEVDVAGRSYSIVKSGVIGLVGIAPTGSTNALILCTSQNDFAQFGSALPGFTIPQALEIFARQGAATVLVVNVFNPLTDTTAVINEPQTVSSGKLKLAYAPIGAITINDAESQPVTFAEGTDYEFDEFGNFTVLSSLISDGDVLKFSYKKLNLSAITAAKINGTQDPETGDRSGTRCWELAYNQFGFNPKILIAPGFSTLTAVASNLRALADKYRGIDYCDAPAGTIVSGALSGRGPGGAIQSFNVNHQRTELLYPQLLRYDEATDTTVPFPFSAFQAGLRQVVDNNEGFWVSTSNHTINCDGVELTVSFQINDTESDTNLLNAAGITTVANTYGTGILSWGNRNSSFPFTTGQKSFTNIIRTFDIVSESMELAAMPYNDKGITQALIDVMREDGNSFMRVLIQRGALPVGSKVVYNPDDNSVDELNNGHVVFEVINAGIPPAERITYKHVLDISLVSNLK